MHDDDVICNIVIHVDDTNLKLPFKLWNNYDVIDVKNLSFIKNYLLRC